MSRIVDIFEHERILPLDGMGALLGDPERTLWDSVQVQQIPAAAVEVGALAVRNVGVAEFEIRIAGQPFLVSMVDWTRLTSQPDGTGIAIGNGTALRAYEPDGDPAAYILVGRSDAGIPMVQQGAGVVPEAGPITIELWVTELSGGLLDRKVHGTGQRHLLVMQCDQDALPPTPPIGTDLRYNGVEPVASVVQLTVWYPSGSRMRSTTTKTWFAFGEARYDPLRGQWVVAAAWTIVDGQDFVSINFGVHWDGPWQTTPYVAGVHNYARIRLADGSWVVRYIGTDGNDHHQEWVPLTQQYVNGSGYRAEPYTQRTSFLFQPEEWRLLRWEWEWDGSAYEDVIGANTYQQRVEKVVGASSIVGAPEQTRSGSAWAVRRMGPVWYFRARRGYGLQAARTRHFDGGGNASDVRFAVQFESSDRNLQLPITHIRFIERGSGSQSVSGWLRTYVL